MTDLEISKALALAIGWKQVLTSTVADTCYVRQGTQAWRVFDFISPDIIWPIAKAFNMFPAKTSDAKWAVDWYGPSEATPELAVAMAVIGGAQ